MLVYYRILQFSWVVNGPSGPLAAVCWMKNAEGFGLFLCPMLMTVLLAGQEGEPETAFQNISRLYFC